VKKGLLLEPTEERYTSAILLCGNLLLHRNVIDNSIMRSAGVEIVRCSENEEEVIALLREVNVSLIVARHSFIEQLSDSGSVILQITNFGKGSHILAVLECDSIEPFAASKMLRLGCRGVLPRQFSSKLFARAVVAIVSRGEIWAPRKLVSELLAELLKAVTLKVQTGLTAQEARILELSSQGYKNSAIADALFISLETVRWHKRRLNRKLKGATQPRHPQKESSPPRVLAG
jgi:DNA-binding NarL/FixJ family response regulator